MRARETAAQDELIATREPAHHSVAARLRVPVETDSRLEVVVVASGDRRSMKRGSLFAAASTG